jgi:hypothetical protein
MCLARGEEMLVSQCIRTDKCLEAKNDKLF